MPRRDTGTVKTRKTGRPHALTPRTADVIVDAVERGNHITTAVHLAGVNHSTFYRWMEKADKIENLIEAGEPYDPDDLVFRDFRDRVLHARARASELMVGVVTKAAVGGYVIEEEPAVDGDGKVIRDEQGQIVMRRRFAQPDGRLALAYLAKASPDQWGQNPVSRLEISGPDGGPVQIGLDPDGTRELTERMAAVYAQRRAEAERRALEAGESEPDDVHEAEIVEDGE